MTRANILVVDDEPLLRDIFSEYLGERGFAVETAADAYEALEKASRFPFDLIFLDIKMPGMDGVEALEKLKEMLPETRFVLMTGYWDQTRYLQDQAEKIGIYRLLEKPFEMEEIARLAEEILAEDG
jgi:two-component system response regulator HydG